MADHRTLVSSEVHEPKFISDSTTVDTGKVITASSTTNGTSEFRELTPSEVGVDQYYGETVLNANTTAFSVTAASDPTLYTNTDYVDLNSVRLSSITAGEVNGTTFSSTDNSLTVNKTGYWKISFWANVVSDTANSLIGIKVKINTTEDNATAKSNLATANAEGNVNGSVIKQLTANDTIALSIASSTSANITVQDLRMHVELIR